MWARLIWGILLLSTAAPLSAQSTKAELFVMVRDPMRLPVAGAKLDLTNTGTRVSLTVETDEEGGFRFSALGPGNYQLTATKPGFAVTRRTGIELRVGNFCSA